MRNLFLLSALTLAAIALTGCGMPGKWTSQSLEPQMARQEAFLFGMHAPDAEFTRATIQLNQDGTYSAEVYYGENLKQSTGTWEKAAGKLTLVDSRGQAYTYRTKLSGDGKHLKLISDVRGTDVVLVMARES